MNCYTLICFILPLLFVCGCDIRDQSSPTGYFLDEESGIRHIKGCVALRDSKSKHIKFCSSYAGNPCEVCLATEVLRRKEEARRVRENERLFSEMDSLFGVRLGEPWMGNESFDRGEAVITPKKGLGAGWKYRITVCGKEKTVCAIQATLDKGSSSTFEHLKKMIEAKYDISLKINKEAEGAENVSFDSEMSGKHRRLKLRCGSPYYGCKITLTLFDGYLMNHHIDSVSRESRNQLKKEAEDKL